ncbi:MAG: DUF4270 domain-containing protein [Paramuribaculum sp.]|nr:DUF4270 domain-containing protein [Paramuribaculum sp.]
MSISILNYYRKMKFLNVSIGCLLLTAFVSCDDDVTTVGNSLVTDSSEIRVETDFTLTGGSVKNEEIQSRNTNQLLGRFDIDEFGALSSDFLTQFLSVNTIDFSGLYQPETMKMRLLMFMRSGDFTGDSIVPMGFKIYPLIGKLKPNELGEVENIASYYDENNCWSPQTEVYSANAMHSDSLSALSYRTIDVTLPQEFTEKFYNEYTNSPTTFQSPASFSEFFPGIYVKNSYGSGRVINISESRVVLSYKRKTTYTNRVGEVRDTILNINNAVMGVTPEVISYNNLNLEISPSLQKRVDAGDAMIIAPAGYDARIQFPTPQILENYNANAGDFSVINSLSLSIPVESIENQFGIQPPQNVLLVLSNKKKEFFKKSELADNTSSFLASYDSTEKCYTFSGLRDYILAMLEKDDELTVDDYTFTITPINLVTEDTSSSYGSGEAVITGVNPYVGTPVMCGLDVANAKIKFIYSKQVINN